MILVPSNLSARNTSFKTSRQKMGSALATVARVSQPPAATSSLISHPTRVNHVSWYENEQYAIKLYHNVKYTSLDRPNAPRAALIRPNPHSNRSNACPVANQLCHASGHRLILCPSTRPSAADKRSHATKHARTTQFHALRRALVLCPSDLRT